ncbi:hypothetical protein SAMN05421787_1033 [Virgibacillus pantothenticus]|nr:hypothetical protein SAMN05421787_1033 [Virgibacillus pantothenticus]
MKFTSLIHHIDEKCLIQSHYELPGNKATGVKGTTKKKYGENLKENIQQLVARMKQKSYRPQPARRTYMWIRLKTIYSPPAILDVWK